MLGTENVRELSTYSPPSPIGASNQSPNLIHEDDVISWAKWKTTGSHFVDTNYAIFKFWILHSKSNIYIQRNY